MLSLVREFSLSSVVCFFYFVENWSEYSVLHLHDIKSDRYFLRATVQMWEYTFGLGLKDEGKFFFLLMLKRIQRKAVDIEFDITVRRYTNSFFSKLIIFSQFEHSPLPPSQSFVHRHLISHSTSSGTRGSFVCIGCSPYWLTFHLHSTGFTSRRSHWWTGNILLNYVELRQIQSVVSFLIWNWF